MKYSGLRVLYLTLNKEWFDKILSGEKPEEYRVLKPYWIRRLMDFSSYPQESKDDTKTFPDDIVFDIHESNHDPVEVMKGYYARFKVFDIIEFKNGYREDSPIMCVVFKGVKIDFGNTKMGAPAHDKCFVIKLGNVISHWKP